MPGQERRTTSADRRATLILASIGRELRAARLAHGLSQRSVAEAAGVEQSDVSRIERGARPGVSIQTLARLAVALGLELGIRVFQAGEPIRDKAHVKLLSRFRTLVGERWQWSAEVPLPIQGDKRAWDRLLRAAGIRIGVEAETKPTDMQELQRRLALKKRDGEVDRLLLVLPNSEWCRRLMRLNDLEESFPVPGKVALRAMQEGRDPGGDAVVLV